MEIPDVVDAVELLAGDRSDDCHVGLLIPTSGTLGMLGASSLQAARLAAYEINATGGVRGRRLSLALVDAGRLTRQLVATVRWLAASGAVEAFVGVHSSDIHRALEATIDSRVPYVFTPPHEGGERREGVVLSGAAPDVQVGASIAHLSRSHRPKRWSLLGNDYVWPHAVHRDAAPFVRNAGAEVVHERLLPFGIDEAIAERLVAELLQHQVDAVLLTLVGRDLVVFNRVLSASPAAGRVLRLACALEENGLLAAGGDASGRMFATMPSFEQAPDGRSAAVHASLEPLFGEAPPMLDSYAIGVYDGLHLVAALDRVGALDVMHCVAAAGHLLGAGVGDPAWSAAPVGAPRPVIQVAQANGLSLDVVAEFAT